MHLMKSIILACYVLSWRNVSITTRKLCITNGNKYDGQVRHRIHKGEAMLVNSAGHASCVCWILYGRKCSLICKRGILLYR